MFTAARLVRAAVFLAAALSPGAAPRENQDLPGIP